MSNFPNHVLVTDFAWENLDIEQATLNRGGYKLKVAKTGSIPELCYLAKDALAILTNWKTVAPEVLQNAPHCQIVSRYGVGVDNIAVQTATELGILVTNVPDYCIDEVSDHALALLLACARGIVRYVRSTQQGEWALRAGFSLPRLRGQTVGLVGFGNTAQALFPKLVGLGMRVIAYTPRIATNALPAPHHSTRNLTELLQASDYVSLHLPATSETAGIVNYAFLAQMKRGAYLINTARGALIDEAALLDALTHGQIAGAALDVLQIEAAYTNNPLLSLPNVIVTPHAAFFSTASIPELQQKAAQHVLDVLCGSQTGNVINPLVLQQKNLRAKWKS
ncbi:MAG TPA: C-terminal binding protein [Anaerolineales bacterium]|nr:C-terminal binding protein [Anaerolineales bacterium]